MKAINDLIIKMSKINKYGRIITFLAVNLAGLFLIWLLKLIFSSIFGALYGATGFGLFAFLAAAATFVLTWGGYAGLAFVDKYATFRSNDKWYKLLGVVAARVLFEIVILLVGLLVISLFTGVILNFVLDEMMGMSWRTARDIVNVVISIESFVGNVLSFVLWLVASFAVQNFFLYRDSKDTSELGLAVNGGEAVKAEAAAPAADPFQSMSFVPVEAPAKEGGVSLSKERQ